MSKRLSIILGLSVLALTACSEESDDVTAPPQTLALTWEDEFDGASGDTPSLERWTYDVGTGDNGWGNQELQFYTQDSGLDSNVYILKTDDSSPEGPEKAACQDGCLIIEAKRENRGGSEYTSGRIKTEGLFAQQYGRIEARIKLPRGRGLWPAFWMLGDDIVDNPWPGAGEIDIMEYRGQEPFKVSGAVHGPGYCGVPELCMNGPLTREYVHTEEADLDENFHVFGIDWNPTNITWTVDGQAFGSVTIANIRLPAVSSRWVFDKPFFLILNLAVGGNFVDFLVDDDVFPQRMVVDYVRVFSRAE